MSTSVSRRIFFARETFHPLTSVPGADPEILSFEAGDRLEHRKNAEDKTGIIALNARSEQAGFVSNEFLVKSKDFHEYQDPWFFGDTPRETADTFLHDEFNIWGTYLVRRSVNSKGDFVIHVKTFDFSKQDFKICRMIIKSHIHGFTHNRITYPTLNGVIDSLVKNGFTHEGNTRLVRLTNPCLIARSQMPGSDVVEPWETHENDIEVGAFIRAEVSGFVYHGRFRGVVDAVVKIIGPLGRRSRSDEQDKQLDVEYNLLWKINHPNVMQLLGMSFNPTTQVYHMVMEGAQEGTLDGFLREKGLEVFTLEEFFMFTRDILQALFYLKINQFLHRNIGAHSVYVNNQMQAKLGNFSLARTHTCDLIDIPFDDRFHWQAIEVLETSRCSHESDVWSFGILMWEMLNFGAIPFCGFSKEQLIWNIQSRYQLPCPSYFPSVEEHMLKKVSKDLLEPCWQLSVCARPNVVQLMETMKKLKDCYHEGIYGDTAPLEQSDDYSQESDEDCHHN